MSNPLAQGVLVGKGRRGVVWMPSIHDEKKRYPFRPIQIRLLHAIASGEPFEEACQKLELSQQDAMRILKRPRCRAYLAELETMDAEVIARSAKGRIAREILDVWDGKTKKDREQMEAGKELWSRVWPKPGIGQGSGHDKIEININVAKIQEAFKRQDALDLEITEEKK